MPFPKGNMFYKLFLLVHIQCENKTKKSEEQLFLLGDSAVLVDPVQHLSMPNQRVLWLQYPLAAC